MPEDIKIVGLKELVLRDFTLNQIFDLGYGEEAKRDFVGGNGHGSRLKIVMMRNNEMFFYSK